MGFIEPLLSSVEDTPLSHLFSLLPLSEQALLAPAVKVLLASLSMLEAMAVVPVVSYYSVLGLIATGSVALLSFSLPSCFSSNIYLD